MNTSKNQQVLMARQPIFDIHQKVVAYELLYRNETNQEHAVLNNATATIDVILNAYTSISDNGELKQVPAFVNITRDILIEQSLPDIPKKNIVLEILENIEPDDQAIAAIRSLNKQGYRIAMDDFIYDKKFDEILKLCHIVKVDVIDMTYEQIQQQVKALSKFKVTLLAEKIENHERLQECIDLGFKLFQGYFLSKPKIIRGKKIDGGQVALMQLIQELQNPNTTPKKLEKLIVCDPNLTYKLLLIVNSAELQLVRKVSSVAQAIVILGLQQVKKWATLIAITSNKNKPTELSRCLLMRGYMCEQIAKNLKKENSNAYFMAGMMSGLHAVLDIEQELMLTQVPLDTEVTSAISEHKGDMGEVLHNVIHYESGDWGLLPADFDGMLYDTAYRDSLKWTKESMQSMYE